MVSIYVSSAPGAEPVTTAEAKTHLRVDTSDDDAYIATLITAARQWIEEMGNLALINTTYVEKFDRFPACGVIELTKGPVSSITSIQYVDENGTTQTWAGANYQTDIRMKPARIAPIYGASFPSTQAALGAVTVTYVAGFGAASTSIPSPIIHAVKLLIAEMYENRENTPRGERQAAKVLLDNYRIQLM